MVTCLTVNVRRAQSRELVLGDRLLLMGFMHSVKPKRDFECINVLTCLKALFEVAAGWMNVFGVVQHNTV